MDVETLRLRALAALTARRITAKKAHQKIRGEEQVPKRPRFTFSDEPNPPPAPLTDAPPEGTVADDKPKDNWQHWYAAAKAAEAATIAGSEGVETYTLVEVPDEFTGILIGKQGAGIKNLQDRTGAIVCIGKLAVEGMRKVCITGCPDSQEAAKAYLMSFVERQQEERDREKQSREEFGTDFVELPNKFAGRLIGNKGQVINQVCQAYGVRANIDDCVNEAIRKLVLRGHWQAVQHAKQHLELLLLELYRRSKIYNAPLESKYSTSYQFESAHAADVAMQQQQDIELSLQPWAAHFAGNLDCISIFEKFQNLEDEKIPGVDEW